MDALNLIAAATFPIGPCEGVIATHVYPLIVGLAVTWRQATGSNDGLGVILVPPQQPDLKPFIIARIVEDGEYLKEIVIGYAERSGDANDPLTPKKLQNALKKGRDTHSLRLTRMEAILERLLEIQEEAPRPVAAPAEQPDQAPGFDEVNLQARIDAMVEDQE